MAYKSTDVTGPSSECLKVIEALIRLYFSDISSQYMYGIGVA